MDRRNFVIGASAMYLLAASKPTIAQDGSAEDIVILSQVPPLPKNLDDQSANNPAPFVESIPVGTGRPSQEEIDTAYDILLSTPYNTRPIEVAQYLLAIGAGAFGLELRPFVREWPVRANPLIFHFFSSTSTKPEGDTTPWCAAFVNWCILRSHALSKDEIGMAPSSFSRGSKPFSQDNIQNYSTGSASSGSFRCWEETKSPKYGDVVVFKNSGTDGLTRACLGSGHVAFYLKNPSSGLVQVLGGNQSQPGSNGAVTVANMKTISGSRFMKYATLKGV